MSGAFDLHQSECIFKVHHIMEISVAVQTPELYQFFVCNSDLPLDSNVQTQLQEMFGISPEEGDRLEREILEDNRFYSI